MSLLTALQFPLTALSSNLMLGNFSLEPSPLSQKLSDAQQITAGFIGGLFSGILCAPNELILIQQQRFGGTIWNTPSRIIRTFGVTKLFRGLTVTCGREAFFCAGYMGAGPVMAKELRQRFQLSEGSSKVLGASVAGLVAATLSHPLDTLKTCKQGDLEQKNFGTLSQTISKLYQEQGIRRFYHGWAWRTSRIIFALWLMGELRFGLAPVFFPERF
eukprot:m.126771 g.126771  ORF g.126771 m.126771 type:complete len:216 (-) comp23513_c1_seq2:31-678(-)